MVPVMLFGVLIRGKKYKPFEYFCVALVTAGITLFQLYGTRLDGWKREAMCVRVCVWGRHVGPAVPSYESTNWPRT